MTDTPVTPTSPPVPRLERAKAFIGDLARPFAIYATSFAAAWATIVTSYKVDDGNDGAFLMGAIFVGVVGLYTAKAIEVLRGTKDAASVEIAKANGPQA